MTRRTSAAARGRPLTLAWCAPLPCECAQLTNPQPSIFMVLAKMICAFAEVQIAVAARSLRKVDAGADQARMTTIAGVTRFSARACVSRSLTSGLWA
eukprot:6191250-Pleurochrysis_carterae.AAC.5